MKRCLVDLNVWVAAVYEGHSHNTRALDWFREADFEFQFCRQTQMGLLRLLTERRVMKDEVRTLIEAWETYDRLRESGVSYCEEPVGLEFDFRAFSNLPLAAPKLWADAYLAAFANAAGLAFATFDAAFANRNQVRDLLVIP